ncbi:MAG: hypothetical protein HWN68_14485, partial [Desulfobacterales bacterium]|nr:hypothetical protein [Desulfobacterales bacterium]
FRSDVLTPFKINQLCLNAEFNVIDTAAGDAGKIFNWVPIVQFTDPIWASELLQSWTSKGFEERAQLNDLPDGIEIGEDGLMTGGNLDGFFAFGAGGSAVYAGQIDDDTEGNHRVSAGFILGADTSPALSDMAGTWVLGMIQGEADEGNSGWGSTDEQLWFGISFGELTVDSIGNVTGEFVFKNAFTGEIDTNPVTATISGPVDECYAVGKAITNPSCGGITLPVFIVTSYEGGSEQVCAKIALDRTRNVISVWQPVDTNGIPYNAPDSCVQDGTETGTGCGNANQRFNFGLGVKVQ